MNRRLAEIQARRARLIARCAAQRDEAAYLLAPWRKPFELVDRGVAAVRYMRAHPGAVALAAAALAVLSPRRALRWVRRGFVFWKGYRWAISALSAIVR